MTPNKLKIIIYANEHFQTMHSNNVATHFKHILFLQSSLTMYYNLEFKADEHTHTTRTMLY